MATCFLLALLPALGLFGASAELTVTIKQASTGSLAPCDVSITDAEGHLVIENESFKSGFRSSGHFTKTLPVGPTQIRVSRGFETQVISTNLELSSGSTELVLKLQRVVELRRRGWYSSDSHVHMLHGERTLPVTFDDVALAARAADLEYLSLAQAWTIEHPTPEVLENQLRGRSSPDCILTWNLEAPKNYYKGDAGRCLGHCWNVGMRGRTREGLNVIDLLLDASAWDYESSKPTYANFESHQLIHTQGGAVFYTHPARWWIGPWGGKGGYPKRERMRVSNMAVELPLDTLIGPTFDGLDILTGSGEQAANAKSFEIWSMLLNHGYRLAATASSDACFDRPGGAIPGVVRTYTFIPDGFSLSKLTQATVAGRTFVTSGPLLLASIDQKPPGTVFHSGSAQRNLFIEGWASGLDPGGLSRLEVLRNGKLFKELSFKPHLAQVQTNLLIQESKNAWYCVRLFGSDPKTQTAVSGAFYFPDKNTRPPASIPAQVHLRVLDKVSGAPISATITEVTFEGTVGQDGKRHWLKSGEANLKVPGTARLRAESKGHRALILSPILDCPEIIQSITSLYDTDLVDWKTFETIQNQLSRIELVFRLETDR